MRFNLKTRDIKASVVLSVIKAPSLKHLIIGWRSLQEWGIFRTQQQMGINQIPTRSPSSDECRKEHQDVCVGGETRKQEPRGNPDPNQTESNQGKNVSLAYNDIILPSDLPRIFEFIEGAAVPKAVPQPSYQKGHVLYAPHSRDHIEELKAYISSLASQETCLLYTSPSPRDMRRSRMPSSA